MNNTQNNKTTLFDVKVGQYFKDKNKNIYICCLTSEGVKDYINIKTGMNFWDEVAEIPIDELDNDYDEVELVSGELNLFEIVSI